MKEERNEALEKLNKALREDEPFRRKFNEIFGGGDKLVLQAVDPAADEADVTGQAGCKCWVYCCGTGCFATFPGAKGHRVG